MARLLVRLAVSATVWAPLCAGDGVLPQALDFSSEALTRRMAELVPDVEAALGEKLQGHVEVVSSTREELAKLVAEDSLELLGEIEGGPRGDELRKLCRQQAEILAPLLFAKIDLKTDRVLVVEANFESQAESGGEAYAKILTLDFLDVILVHESIHSFQDRKFGLKKLFGKLKTQEEFRARQSVCEGHAQFITRKVAEKRKLSETFELLEKVMSEVPSRVTDPAERLIRETAQQITSFPYVQGRKFFAALEGRLGYEKALARVFAQPPSADAEVSRPEEYLDPPRSRLDLGKLAQKAVLLISDQKYLSRVVTAPENVFRKGCMIAGNDAVEKGFKGYRGAAVIVALVVSKTQPAATPGAQLDISMIELDSQDGAKRFLELEEIVAKKKDEQFKAPGGLAQILSSRYEKVDGPGPRGTFFDKQLKIQGIEENQSVRTLVVTHKNFVLEASAVYTAETRAELEALTGKIASLIDEATR